MAIRKISILGFLHILKQELYHRVVVCQCHFILTNSGEKVFFQHLIFQSNGFYFFLTPGF
jgi:hypothetical protein